MPAYRFKQVDVFTSRPLFGNPVAVVLEADGIDPAEMQRIAGWTNLSETTFVLRPTAEADYRLRIFYPQGELPFAGHPVVGSAHAVLEAGVVPAGQREFKQECGAGILPLRVDGEGGDRRIFVVAPKASSGHEFATSRDAISSALGARLDSSTPPLALNNGPVWLFCRVEDESVVAGLKPDMGAMARLSRDLSVSGFAVFALVRGAEHSVRIRCFAPAGGVPEDPVTGSANAALPTYLVRHDLLRETGREYVSSQGRELGRDGRVHVRVLDDEGLAEIGGQAVTVIEGEIRL